jgi:hypothetical protein
MNRTQFSSLIKKGRKKMYHGKNAMAKKKTTKTKKKKMAKKKNGKK